MVVDSATYRMTRDAEPLFHVLALPGLGTGLSRVLGPIVGPRKIRAGIEESFRGMKPSDEFVALRERIWNQPKVNHALAEFIRRRGQREIAELFGSIEFVPGFDHKKLRNKR